MKRGKSKRNSLSPSVHDSLQHKSQRLLDCSCANGVFFLQQNAHVICVCVSLIAPESAVAVEEVLLSTVEPFEYYQFIIINLLVSIYYYQFIIVNLL